MNKKVLLCAMALLPAALAFGQDLRITADNKGRVGFSDMSGNVVIQCKYETASPFDGDVAVVSKSGKSGMIDKSGKELLPVKYAKISKWSSNLFLVDDGKKKGLADRTGAFVLPVKYLSISRPNCYGKALIAMGGKITALNGIRTLVNSKLGIVDNNGTVLITPQYKGLYEFSEKGEGYYPYHEGMRLSPIYSQPADDTLKTDCSFLGFNKKPDYHKCGIMDGNGKILMQPGKYSIIMLPKSGMSRYYIINSKNTVFGYYNIETGEDLVAGVSEKQIGSINYWSHGDFMGNIAPVNGNNWKFIDKSGNTVASGYNSLLLGKYVNLWAAQNTSQTWDVFDTDGSKVEKLSGYQEILFPKNKEDIEIFSVKKNDKWGGISRSAEVIVPFEYDKMLANNHDMICVNKSNKWGAVTPTNKLLVPTEYTNLIFPAKSGEKHLWVSKADSLYYHFNVETQATSGQGYKTVWAFKNGVAFVVPADMSVEDNSLNRAQMLAPNAKPADLEAANVKSNVFNFGYLIGEDDAYLISEPLYYTCYDKAVNEIKRHGYTKLNKTQMKSVLFNVTRENRYFKLGDILGETEWDY